MQYCYLLQRIQTKKMSKFNLKSVFSTPLIIFSPLRKLNGFLGGLIIGAIFSLVVNMVTVQVQEVIQKQRILEAVENEIVGNMLQASGIVQQNAKYLENNKEPSIFDNYSKYSNDLWTQSTEPLQYLAQLDPSIQIKVIVYYTSTVKSMNNFVSKYEKLADLKLTDCYGLSPMNNEQKDICNSWYRTIVGMEAETAHDMYKESQNVLNVFHPTKDRLNSSILKLFMGNKSVGILSI